MLHLGMMVRNDTLNNPFVISIGARAYYGDVGHKVSEPNSSFAAISVGGELLFIPDSLGGLGFGAYYFYAPPVVTYKDADNFREYGVSLNYEITQQATISIGYQKIKVELNNGIDLEVASNAFFGIGLRF